MPGFVKTPADEARWSKAKEAANKTLSESAGDSYWALVNSIFQKMKKSQEDIDVLESVLLKARRRLSDEQPDEEEDQPSMEEAGMHEINPDEQDDAEKWLSENDPKAGKDEDEYNEYAPGEDEEAHQRSVGGSGSEEGRSTEPAETATEEGSQVEPTEGQGEETKEVNEGRFPQPSREELADMRQYSRPWEQRAREKTRLEAEASKNPVLAHEGKLVEARNLSHRDQQEAYTKMQTSPEYQNADPITQMEMDSKFEADWHKQHPDYLANAARAHTQAHIEGLKGMGEGAKAKKEAIQHARMGGAQPEESMSTEEAMQHAGGEKGEEGTMGSMVQDPAAKFAREHHKFLEEEGGKHESRAADRAKFYTDMSQRYASQHKGIPEYQKGDIHKILGDHPAMKDPDKKAKVDTFFQKYHPLIHMSAGRVLNQLGMNKGGVDMGMLHEAGMHGLFQAINDYNHDNPSKASFASHAGNKMRGLMQTALREQNAVPLQTEAKKYNLKKLMAKQPAELRDRHTRIETARQAQIPKVPKSTGGGETNG